MTPKKAETLGESDKETGQSSSRAAVTMATAHGRVVADALTLHLMFPNNQRLEISGFDPFSSYGQLKQLVADALGMHDTSRIHLLRRHRSHKMRAWKPLDLQDDETLVGAIRNGDTLRVEIRLKEPHSNTRKHSSMAPQLFATIGTSHDLSWDIGIPRLYGNHGCTTEKKENRDEEYALNLQTEECGRHHDKLEMDRATNQSSNDVYYQHDVSSVEKYSPTVAATSFGALGCSTKERLEDYGQVVLKGTHSQYDVNGGESACTSICLVAAKHLLLSQDSTSLTCDLLDKIVKLGVNKHGVAVGSGHASLEDLWSLPAFADYESCLSRGNTTTHMVEMDAFYQVLENAWQYAVDNQVDRVAVVLTKSPETVLCFATGLDQWYLLDSHGQVDEETKVTYLMKFESSTALALALQAKFPPLPSDGDNNWQVEMYNMFEATPLIAVPHHCETHNHKMSSHDEIENAQVMTEEHDASMTPPVESPTEEDDRKPAAVIQPVLSNRHLDMYMDPITLEIMADPVVCDDGHTYDRSVIEHHFQSRREAEEARQNGEEDDDSAATGCGARRAIIELTSPLSGEVVTDRLVPNRFVEQQIVDLVEANSFDMSNEDLDEWKLRREAKRENDIKRMEEDKRLREEEERMQQQREEALERRAAEAASGEARDPAVSVSIPVGPSELVRVDRPRDQRLLTEDLGISVALCEKSSFVPPEYFGRESHERILRCMVSCCAVRLNQDGLNWCERCGRLVCRGCLGFQVTKYTLSPTEELHRVCGECVMQILDAMPRDGTAGQARALLFKLHFEPYKNELIHRAVTAQDVQAQEAASKQFGLAIHELQQDIQDLKDKRNELQDQIYEAKQRQDEARKDDGMSGMPESSDAAWEVVVEWEQTCAELSERYDALLVKRITGNDWEEQLAHAEAISEVSSRLESAQTCLAEARSRLPSARIPTTVSAENTFTTTESDGESVTKLLETNRDIAELERAVDALQRQHHDLVTKDVPHDEEAQIAHAQALSDVINRFEIAQGQLLEARTRSSAPKITSPKRSFNDIAELVIKFVEHVRTCSQPKPAAEKQRSVRSFFKKRKSSKEEMVDVAPVVAYRLSKLLQVGRELQRKHSLTERRKSLETLHQTLGALPGDVCNMGTDIQSMYDELMQEVNSALALRNGTTPNGQAKLKTAPSQVSASGKAVEDMNLQELQYELFVLTKALGNTSDVDKITSIMMRTSEIVQRLEPAQASSSPETRAGEPEPVDEADGSKAATALEHKGCDDPGLLEAIGRVDMDWPLPLELDYPTVAMKNELELLANTLEQNLPRSQRKYDDEFSQKRRALNDERDQLEDEIAKLEAEAQTAEAVADVEQKRLEARRERRCQEELERQERERARLEQERKAREAEQALRQKHAADEAATRQAFASAVGLEGNARLSGDSGDLRMCRLCRAGPVSVKDCRDLKAHNDSSTTYKGSTVARTKNPNACGNCGHFESDWHSWLLWDGIYGPH